jgi:hypothetical protein
MCRFGFGKFLACRPKKRHSLTRYILPAKRVTILPDDRKGRGQAGFWLRLLFRTVTTCNRQQGMYNCAALSQDLNERDS